ncbi:hypothetical protein RE432_17545 [Pusillimonas sp. SM2304]|uniref:DUF3592 domain-containing protein n=1 Tax=Pusillimonas sp. SM2304 TaxID=3073241 RepID=UPI0028766845|nr:DUF3592 domain-containing protein [Pusillimonas sp. SM2304]MDS1142243.1 hypothetical protein [Pusillimonas sp. SM2304]
MPSDLAVILGAAAFAVLFGGIMIQTLIKENSHPAWLWILLAFSVLIFVLLSAAFLPSREAKLADRLSRSSHAGHATGRVVHMRRLNTSESTTLRETKLDLELLLRESDGRTRTVPVVVWVEDVMLHRFATGSTVHVLYDPLAPSKVAIDRRKTPVQLQ